MSGIRRVVTGNIDGRSVFVSDEIEVGERFDTVPGFGQALIWATDTVPQGGDDCTDVQLSTVLPPAGGSRFLIVTFPPDSVMQSSDFDPVAAGQEYQTRLRDFAACFEPAHPGMHTTMTLDYGILLSGQLWLELDDNQLRELSPGDVVVQRQTRHAWRNMSDAPAVIAFVLIGVAE